MWISSDTNREVFELDELYWYIKEKARTQTGENVYVIAAISLEPRQIVSYSVTTSKAAGELQEVVDSAPQAQRYSTDGYHGYCDVDYFGGQHIRNLRDKSDTHNVESVNADLRHYISGLARRSRCFYRSTETLEAVVSVFVNAYNKFGEAKLKYRIPTRHKSDPAGRHLHKYRELPFSFLDFL